MTVDFDTLKWVVPTVLAVLSFYYGGGTPSKRRMETGDLQLVERLKARMLLRAEFDAHVHDESMWREQMHENAIEPIKKITEVLQNHAILLAAQGESMKHIAKALDANTAAVERMAQRA